MRILPIGVLRSPHPKLRRLESVVPWLLFLLMLAAFAALAAAVDARSLPLTICAAIAVVASVVGMATWILAEDRRAAGRPRRVRWRKRDWEDFEAAFWSYVERASDARR